MSFKRGGYCFFAVVRILLFDLYNGVEPTASARCNVDVSDLADFANFTVDGGFLGHAHEELVLVFAGEDCLVDGVFAVGYAFDFYDRLLAFSVNDAG
jgi:hypothetical protein